MAWPRKHCTATIRPRLLHIPTSVCRQPFTQIYRRLTSCIGSGESRHRRRSDLIVGEAALTMVAVDKSPAPPLNTSRYHGNIEDDSLSIPLGLLSSSTFSSPPSSPSSPTSSSTSSSSVSTGLSAAKPLYGSTMLRSGAKPRIFVQCCRGLFNLT